MNRGKRAFYNSVSNILLQLVTLVCSFILPRLILSRFGSSYNGITTSVTQFMSVIALLKSGIGGATRAALYKPLAEKDTDQISATILATEKFMRKVSLIFAAFIFCFSCAYPLLVSAEFDWLFSASLVMIISISTFVQNYFGITYQLLLEADQRKYVHTLIEIAAVILNVVIAAVLINIGCGIHMVKLGSALVYSASPIFLHFYVRRNYKLRRDVAPDHKSINQRWAAFFHQIAFFIHNNTDIALLTIFSTTKEISVYSIHYMVANGLRKILATVSTGFGAVFGNMLAKNETAVLRRTLDMYELLLHVVATILFGAAFVLTTPFVGVYTRGISDVSYYRPLFAQIMIVAELLYSLRTPCQSLVVAAGHFKQTKKYAAVEAALNLVISLILVSRYGVVGLVIGTLISIIYRNFCYILYTSREILQIKPFVFYKRFAITGICMVLIALLPKIIPAGEITNYLQWIIYAIKITVLAIIITLGVNIAFYRKLMAELIRKISSIISSVIRRR